MSAASAILAAALLPPHSPTEFERQSGKGCSKKWKATIRVRKANGLPGMTMGDWLLQMGYEQPKPASAAGETGIRSRENSLNEIRRRQFSRRAAALGASPPTGREDGVREVRPAPERGSSGANRGTVSHRPNCMCVICKQARRKAAQEKGVPFLEDAVAMATTVAAKAPAGEGGAAAGGSRGFRVPEWLIGKRAFVQAVAHVVRGAAQHEQYKLPQSKSYTAEEWDAALQSAGPGGEDAAGVAAIAAAAAAGGAAGSSKPGTPGPSLGAAPGTPAGPDSRASTPVPGDEAAAVTPAAAAAAADGDGEGEGAKGSEVVVAAEGAEGEQQQGGAAATQQLAVRGGRSTTWRSKLRVCQVRVCCFCGKASGIAWVCWPHRNGIAHRVKPGDPDRLMYLKACSRLA